MVKGKGKRMYISSPRILIANSCILLFNYCYIYFKYLNIILMTILMLSHNVLFSLALVSFPVTLWQLLTCNAVPGVIQNFKFVKKRSNLYKKISFCIFNLLTLIIINYGCSCYRQPLFFSPKYIISSSSFVSNLFSSLSHNDWSAILAVLSTSTPGALHHIFLFWQSL